MSKTIRKPDGSYETTKVTKDSQGNTTTTITRTIDGKSETITTYDNAGGSGVIKQKEGGIAKSEEYSDRNIYVTKEGYAVPRNLWWPVVLIGRILVGNLLPVYIQIQIYYVLVTRSLSVWCFRWNSIEATDSR